MHTPLTALTLSPQPPKPYFQFTNLSQRLRIQLPSPRATIVAHGTCLLVRADERFLATHTRLRFFREFHQAAEGGCSNGDGAGVFACKELARFLLAEDGIEDAAEGLGELIVKVVFSVNRDVVFKDKNRVFGFLVVLAAAGTLDDYVGNAIAQGGCGAGIAFSHTFGEFDMRLLSCIVTFGEGFRDNEL